MLTLLLFYADEQALTRLDAAERNRLVDRHVRYRQEVASTGARILGSRALQPSRTAVTVRPVDGRLRVSHGSPLRGRDTVIGYYLVDCGDLDEATGLAKRYPMPEGLGCIEVRPVMEAWTYAPSVETRASTATVWRCYEDVSRWHEWKACVERVDLDGPFATGTRGWLTPAGGQPLPLRLTSVHPGRGYTSETRIAEDIVLRLDHVLTPRPEGGTTITHTVTMPRSALDLHGMEFSPRFNAGMLTTLEAVAARALALEQGESAS